MSLFSPRCNDEQVSRETSRSKYDIFIVFVSFFEEINEEMIATLNLISQPRFTLNILNILYYKTTLDDKLNIG